MKNYFGNLRLLDCLMRKNKFFLKMVLNSIVNIVIR